MSCPVQDIACSILQKVLKGRWRSISEDIDACRIKNAGLFYQLYVCSLPLDKQDQDTDAIVRIYDKQEDIKPSAIAAASLTLQNKGLGPKIYQLSDDFRVEEYFVSHSWSSKNRYKELVKNKPAVLARRLAELHSLDVPVEREPTFLDEKLESCSIFFKGFPNKQNKKKLPEHVRRQMKNVNIKKSITWVKTTLEKMKSKEMLPVVYCLNGLPEENILCNRNESDTIDAESLMFCSEYCSYNYRGFDIANIFNESSVCYNGNTFEEVPEKVCEFIEAYLEKIDGSLPSENDIQCVLKEVQFFLAVSHLFWALRALKKALNPTEPPSDELWNFVVVKLRDFASEKAAYEEKSGNQ